MNNKVAYSDINSYRQKIAESTAEYHSRQATEPVEKKYQTLLRLQKLHLSLQKNKGTPITSMQYVWGKNLNK